MFGDNLLATENRAMFVFFIIILLLIIFGISLHILRRYLKKAKKAELEKKRLLRLEAPIIIIVILLVLQFILGSILSNDAITSKSVTGITNTIMVWAFTYVLTVLGGIIIDNWSDHVSKARMDARHEEIVPLVKSITNIILTLAALFVTLHLWGVQIGGLLASIGVVGIILSFAFKDTLSNIFGGLSLIMDNSFKKGDLLELDDGEFGFVMETNLRSTKLKGFDNKELVIPNGMLANMKIKNYALPNSVIRIKVQVGVAYGTKVEEFEKIMYELMNSNKNILKYPKPQIMLEKLSDFSLEFSLLFFISDFHNMLSIKSQVTKDVYATLGKNGIKIPFPTRTVYMKKI